MLQKFIEIQKRLFFNSFPTMISHFIEVEDGRFELVNQKIVIISNDYNIAYVLFSAIVNKVFLGDVSRLTLKSFINLSIWHPTMTK